MSAIEFRLSMIAIVLLISGVCAGCGSSEEGPELTPATGMVMLDDKPLVNADVYFLPINDTPGIGGKGRTREEGEFEIVYYRGGQGLPAGDYRVAVSYRLMPDGAPVPENDTTPPIESPARESLPSRYSSQEQSALRATVASGQPVELKLTTKK
ncbi:hypothetical protein M4951_12520 [Blastopirellula sp. J2-11]|uniref:hypothetical protein n=1 Tax=Blastopirellula sp. J2-11 TaxID=2943192 RepID=UPI0021C8D12F|nr:hypothetical protein [Blastopirellula sp. J2-11]UUO09107.1 hypothetical protein M4951_12520 [Blastopirellula sp. J2-11]